MKGNLWKIKYEAHRKSDGYREPDGYMDFVTLSTDMLTAMRAAVSQLKETSDDVEYRVISCYLQRTALDVDVDSFLLALDRESDGS